jgi:hypothetical protein
MDAQEARKAQAQLGNAKEQEIYPVTNQKNQTILVKDELKPEHTLFIKGCEDCTIEVRSRCTKVMIEGCRRTKVHLHSRIITNIVEAWKCADFLLNCQTEVKTLQLDICRKFDTKFSTRDNLPNITWAGVYDLTITFDDEPNAEPHITGYEHMKPSYPDINPIHDQFIMRVIKNEIVTEQVVRLANGFPTTEREAQEFDTQKEKNEKNVEEYVRNRLKDAGISLGKKKAAGPKVGRNDPCPCGSGKKAKKCCSDPAKAV